MDLNTVQLIAIELFIMVLGIYLTVKCFSFRKIINSMKYFWSFVFVLTIGLIINIPIRFVELHLVCWNRHIVSMMYSSSLVILALYCFYWWLFLLKTTESTFVNKKWKVHVALIPVGLTIFLCVINHWTHWLYYIDENSCYHRGSIFILQAVVSYFYSAMIIIFNVVYLFKFREHIVVRKGLYIFIPMIISNILQFAFGGSYLLAGSVFCALGMYIEICLASQKNLEINNLVEDNIKTIHSIFDVCHIIYDIDLVQDTFREIKAPVQVSEFCNQFKSARECLRALPDSMFYEDDIPAMKELYNPDTFNQRLKASNICIGDGQGLYSSYWLRTIFVVSERDKDGNITRIVVTLQNINSEKERQKKDEEALFYKKYATEMKELFTQTAEALAIAIDAKDKYTHGHSVRVAEYSKKIAQLAGFEEDACEEVYFAGLLHDVGKIGIPDEIIQKNSKLTEKEYAQIKNHPVTGKEILRSISKLPYLSIGANYHHERYDGRGYPEGLKATDIPTIARIISVADAYDSMTSKRVYRDPLPQQKVREEIIKGMGNQFDPKFASIMLQLIELDTDYQMIDKSDVKNTFGYDDLVCDEYKKQVTEGIIVNRNKVFIRFHCIRNKDSESNYPSIILFDSLDGRVHVGEREQKDLSYYEYSAIRCDGIHTDSFVRKTEFTCKSVENANYDSESFYVEIEAVKFKDHIMLHLNNGNMLTDAILAISDNSHFAYISISGENCRISDINVYRDRDEYPEEKIKRIVEEISYIKGTEGDIPSIQVDSWRTETSKGILIKNKLNLSFHMISLPFSRLVWHCPFIVIYTSEDGEVNGKGYREFGFIRFDGESWQSDAKAKNVLTINHSDEYKGWDEWKIGNKKGRNISLSLYRKDNEISLSTSCGGICINNTTIIDDYVDNLYMAITGDQCVIENIKIINNV